MKCFGIVVLLAAGILSAPRFSDDFGSLERYFLSKRSDCGDLERLNSQATTIFDYVGETRNTIKGSTPDDTGILVKARIYINALKACKFSMQISEVELLTKSKTQNDFRAATESVKFNRDLQAQELIFKVSNGKITKLLPSPDEPIHILNIKRGILSTLQLGTPATTEEVDVNGRCKVTIVEKDGEIVKSKNIAECSERALNEVGYQTTSFEKSDLPIKPLDSTSVCKYTMLKDRIRSVNCQETHIFRPFSAGYESPSGAISIIKQKLTFKEEKSGYLSSMRTGSRLVGVSLIYQHEKEEIKPDRSIVHRLDRIMNNLVDNSMVNNLAAKQSSAHDFTKLVEILRKLDRKTMISLWDKYFDCERSTLCKIGDAIKNVYRQYLIDALTYCGTETCVYTVQNVIVNDEIGRETTNTFLQGIALVAKPTKPMIRDVLNIAKKKASRQSFLTLGTLMSRYCSKNIARCAYDNTNPITHAELFLEEKLGKDCSGQGNDENTEEILMALKAIGNAGRPIRAWQTLLNCAENSIHQNISVAALDALRRMPCNKKIQNALHKMHENIAMDPETRIHVYLALMRCPTENTLRRVVERLEKEKSRQVGSFMASHLKNLNESSDPRHKKTQNVLITILKKEPVEKFNLDLTKYSRAFEGSVHSGWLKSGASVESHLIFSPNSYIPRSALLNMTATILNVPVNILEMAARVEGLETLLEDLFGADGYFPDNNILKMFNITFTKDDIAKLRSRRHVRDDTLDENIAKLDEKISKKRIRPSGNLNIKVFGQEMRVFSYDDIFWAADQIDNMNVIELLLQFAKGGHKTFTKSMLFLEMTHTVPTGLGLPLKLKLTGSTVASLELNGKVDIRNMFWGPRSMEIKGYVRPSAVVELAGQMGIHSHYVESGIFVNSSMFTSQKLKGAVIYKDGQTLQINLDAPEEPNQLFNFSSTPFLFLNEEANLVEGAPRRITPDFCIHSTMVLGLGLCTRLSLPVAFREYEAPYFPLSGSSSFGMSLVKSDPKLTTYQFSINMKKTNTIMKNEFVGWFEMGTPGATYSRHLAGIIKFVKTRTSRTLTIGSFEGDMINGQQIKTKTEFMVSYHSDTNRFEMDFRSKLYTGKTIKMKFLYFNDTHYFGKEMGVLMSAEYDWYKFKHLIKFVKKTTSYLLQSRTTYWPNKQLTSEILFVPAIKSISVRFNANQIKQSIEIIGKYTKTKTEKGLKFTVTHLSTKTKTSFYVGILNDKSAKKFIINGTSLGKEAELTWGYYVREMIRELRFNANIAGNTMVLFAEYNKITNSWLTATIGGTVGKNKIGISTEYLKKDYSFDRTICSFIFYNGQKPLKTCLELKKVSGSWATPEYKRLMWTTTIFSRSVAIAFDYKNNNDKYDLTTFATYGDKIIFTNIWELMYDSIWNTELKMTMELGKNTVSTRWFSTMLKGSLFTFGIEARGFKKTVKLISTYSKEIKEDTLIHSITSEVWVNKKLPMSFSINLEFGKTIKGLSSIFKIKSYMVKHSLLWIQPEANKYSCVVDFVISKGNFVMFRNKLTDILTWNSAQKAYKLMWEFMIWNKKFEYGWDVTYQNHGPASKILNFGLNYARNRRSSITTTLSNTYYNIELLIDVEYLPQRHMSHVVRFHKEARQLDVVLEFLPKMFVKFMGRLDKVDGWRLTTDVTFDWQNYRSVLRRLTAYMKKNMNIVFAVKLDMEKKQVRFSTKVLNRIIGFVARLDTKSYLSSFHVFYQKNLVGWTAYLDKKNKALLYNITLTPKLSGQVALEIVKDHIIKLTLLRKIGINIVSETTLRYELRRESCKLALQWNIDTLKYVRNIITPVIGVGDFVAARDRLGGIVVSIIESTKLIRFGFEETSNLRQSRKITRKALNFAENIYKVTKRMAESGVPVVKTAIKLVKEIRIRERTVEQIMKQVIDIMKNNAENIAEYIKDIPLPYRFEKFEEMYDKTIADLLSRLEHFNWEKTGKRIMTDIYTKSATLKTNAKLYHKKVSELFPYYKDLVDSWYVNNKEKSLRMLYLDTKSILIDQYKNKMENIKKMLKKRYSTVLPKLTEMKENLKNIWTEAKNRIDEITDDKTKKIAMDALELSENYFKKVLDIFTNYYKQLKTLPNWFENQCKTFCNNKWNWLKEKENSYSLYPITNNGIWGELAEEFLNHEIVSELKRFALKGKKAALEYRYKITDYANVDKMTLEDVVTKIKELETSIKNKKDVMVQKFRKTYEVEITKFLTYYNKAKAIGEKYIGETKILWNNNYPKLVEKATLKWKLAMVKVEELKKKYTKLAKEIKEKYTEKVLEPWNNSELKQKLDTLKMMTIKKVIEEIMKLQEKTKTMTRNLYKKAVAEVKYRFDTYLLPYVDITKKNVITIFNEINENALFIYRYYRLKDNFMSAMTTYIKPYWINMKTYIPDFKKYVILDTKRGELVLSIPHYKSIEPSFTYHTNKVADQIEKLDQTLRTNSARVMKSAIATFKLMLEKMKSKSRELRKDLDASMILRKMVGWNLLIRAKVMNNEAYDIASGMYKDLYHITMEISDRVLKTVQKETKPIYAKTEAAIFDIYKANSIQEAVDKTKAHCKIVIDNAKALVLPYYRATDRFCKNMKLQYYKLLNKARPYYAIVKTAIMDWRSGTDLKTAFSVIELELEKTYRIMKNDFQTNVNEFKKSIKNCINKDTRKIAREYLKTYQVILGRYGKRIFKLYKFTKARLDRAIRIAKIVAGKYWKKPIEVMNPYRSVAMIFGKSHVITFDNKYYDVPTYSKPDCTYLLARDFQRGSFTILSQKEHLIVKTPDMTVKIHMNGKVVSIKNKETVEDLPVQSDTGFCKRIAHFIICDFKQGLRIRCDKEHSLCTIELSGWHYSKSQGLLGTNNHEVYDDMKLPDGTITQSMIEFINAWEVSGDIRCLINEWDNKGQSCNKAPSEQCFKLLKEKTSPYGALFGVVDPVPFLKACQIDSADCETKEPYETSHCNATAAYIHMLRLKGIWVPLPKDCLTYTTEAGKTYKFGQSWEQQSTKSVDVVVMISERSKAKSVGKEIASLLVNLNYKLNGFSTRFALIGFGGNGVRQAPHHHTLNGKMFNDVSKLERTIINMPYNGSNKNLNDAYGAILLASKLQFRPVAARVFLLFNFDEYKPCAWYGPTLDETIMSVKYESNAAILAFDQFNFKSIARSKIIGQNEKNVYLFSRRVIRLPTLELPKSPFTKLVKVSHGGMFTNKLKQSQEQIIKMAVTDTFLQILKTNSHSYKSCEVRGCRFAGQATPICRNKDRVQY